MNAHLEQCADCRLEAGMAELLAYRTPADSPAGTLDDVSRRRRIDAVVAQALAQGPSEALNASPQAALEPPSEAQARRAWQGRLAVAVALVLLVAGIGWLLAGRLGIGRPPEHGGEARRRALARLLLASGTVKVNDAPADPGAAPGVGSRISVGSGQVVLGLPADARVWLGPGAALRLDRLAERDVALTLIRGKLLASVTPTARPRRFRVTTPGGQVVVHGTVFAVEAEGAVLRVQVLRGEVRVVPPGRAAMVLRPGRGLQVRGGQVSPWVPAEANRQELRAGVRLLDLLGQQRAAWLTVRSVPRGAEVLLDGTLLGRTPLAVALEPGDRRLTVQAPGRVLVREQLALRPGSRLWRTYELEPAKVHATPRAAAEASGVPARAATSSPSDDGEPLVLAPAVLRAEARPRQGDAAAAMQRLLGRARAARARRAWGEAAAAYEELIARFGATPQGWTARVALGLLLLHHLGRPAAALRRFNEYLRGRPGGGLGPEAAFGRAQALRRLGRTRLEQEALRAFLRRYPRAVQAELARARLGVLQGVAPRRPADPRGVP